RRRRREAFVPAPERKGDRALDDRRAHDRADDVGLPRDQLGAHALRVSVDVGPAPLRAPVHPLLRRLGADPLLARAGDRQLQGLLVVGIAVLLAQAVARLLAQLGQHLGVVGQLADALGAPRAVRGLLLDGEAGARHLLPAREVAVQLLVLPDLARSVARDGARAGVNQAPALDPAG